MKLHRLCTEVAIQILQRKILVVFLLVSPVLLSPGLVSQEQSDANDTDIKKLFEKNPELALKRVQEESLERRKNFVSSMVDLYQGGDWTLALKAGTVLRETGTEAPGTVLPIILDRLKSARKNGDRTGRLRNIRMLGDMGVAQDPVVKQLVKELKSDEEAFQRSALAALANLGTGASRALPDVKKFLDHPSLSMRRQAFATLRKCGKGKPLVSSLGPALTSRDPYIRRSALRLIEQTDASVKRVISPLFKMVRDETNKNATRTSALSMIARAGTEASGLVDQLVAFGRSAPASMRPQVQETLNSIKKDNTAPSTKSLSLNCREGKTVRFTCQADDPDDLTDGLRANIIQKPKHGSLNREGKRTFIYRSKYGNTETVTFKWRMKDPRDQSPPEKATIRIQPDTSPPIIQTARVVDTDRKAIRIHMNEPVTAESAEKAGNYRLNGSDISKVSLVQKGYVVRLTTGVLDPEQSYEIAVSGLADRSSRGNPISSDVTLPVVQEVAERNGLLLYGPADGHPNDASEHGRDGTLTDGASISNRMGKGGAFQFAGQKGNKKNAVNFGKVEELQAADTFTVGFWFRRKEHLNSDSNHGTSNIMFSQGSDSANDNLEIGTDGKNVEVYMDTESGGGTDSWNGGITENRWYHLAFSYDSSRKREAWLYLNGKTIKKWSMGGPLRSAGAPVTIGNTFHQEAPFSGWMDEVFVYDRALNAEEINELKGIQPYQRGKEPYRSEQLVLLAPGDGDAQDRSGYRRHGTISGNVRIPEKLGKEGAFSFGADKEKTGTVQFPMGRSLSGARHMTVAFWFRRRINDRKSSDKNSSVDLFRYGTADTNSITTISASSSGLSANLRTDRGKETMNWKKDLEEGRWYHLTLTYNGAEQKARLFVDGKEVSTLSDTGKKLKEINQTVKVSLGATENGERVSSGYLDELILYRRSLGTDEVKRVKGYRPHSRKNLLLLARGNGSPEDRSGNKHHGKLRDGASITKKEGIRGAFRFAGKEGNKQNSVNFGKIKGLQEAKSLSVAFWFRRTKDRGGTSNHGTANIMFSQGGDDPNDNFEIGTSGSNVQVYLQSQETNDIKEWNGSIENDRWYHLAFTYNANRKNEAWLYINGEVVKKWSGWEGGLVEAPSPVTIGNTFHVETPFQGLMDEVFVYGRSLNSDEIHTIIEPQGE